MKKSLNIFNTMFDEGINLLSLRNDGRMRTDIKEYDDHYLFEIDLAGIKKENIVVKMEEDYMIVSVSPFNSQNSEDYEYIRKERYDGKMERSYYVGNVKEEDITATYINGVLSIIVMKEKEEQVDKNIINIL